MDDPIDPADAQPKIADGTGVAMHNDYPYNSRLRAEAMARDGTTSDPDGLIDDALIVDTRERLEREAEAEKANTPSMAWLRDRLMARALATPGVEVAPDADKATILDAIQAADEPKTMEG